MGLAALSADAAIGCLAARWQWGLLRMAGTALVAALTVAPAWRAMEVHFTNVDQSAEELNRSAKSGDLIVVNPWTYGITFGRYYHGAAEWTTMPELEDHRTHRLDLVRQWMQTPSAAAPVLEKAERTLRGGGRVWVVGTIVESNSPPEELPAATDDPRTWHRPYIRQWSAQLGWRLWTVAARFEKKDLPRSPVSPQETTALYFAEGVR
jgi:hypothetical protein